VYLAAFWASFLDDFNNLELIEPYGGRSGES